MARVEFVDALNGTLTDAEALAGDMPQNLRDAIALTDGDLTASRAVVTDADGKLTASAVTATELGYVSGVTSAIQTQLAAKAPLASPTFTGTVSGITKSMVGLGNVDNTSDANKPVSTATQAALDLKAPLASPALTGTPTVPTAAQGTNTTQAASTAFVVAEIAASAGTGDVVGPASSTANTIAGFSDTTGKLLKQLSATEGRAALSLATSDSPQFTGIELGHATDTTITRSAAGSLAVEGVVVAMTGKQAIPIPAGAMKSRTTNGAAAGSAEMTTNKNMFVTLDFDASTQEFAQFSIAMPKSWDESTVTFVPVWSHASTTTNFGVVWSLAGVALSNDDAGDVAFGTAATSTDTGGTTNDIYMGPESSAITIAGTPAAEDLVMFQVAREPADGSDTMAIDARLHGITLYITTNAGNDA